jgi:hypothetical protein
VVEQIAHGIESGFFIAKFIDIACAEQRLKVGEGNGWWGGLVFTARLEEGATRLTPPSTMAIAAAGAEVGVFGRQRSRLDSEDGIRVGILRRDGGAALTLAH